MNKCFHAVAVAALAGLTAAGAAAAASDNSRWGHHSRHSESSPPAQLGPRPFFLVDDMSDGPLKDSLQQCAKRGQFSRTEFSIGHRGAPLQFPEHTVESYTAAARMGAGIVECDVTFTKDKELVCRHAQNDLHTTTNILDTPLAAKCTKPFTAASIDAEGKLLTPAAAECRTSDITLAEFKTLRGKMDASNPRARTVKEYLDGTPAFRTDLYTGPTSGTLLTHKESIELFKKLGVKMTPELKEASVPMPFEGFTQEAYARKMIDEYKQAMVPPSHVWPQSFSIEDVVYWVQNEAAFGRQAVFLDDAGTVADLPSYAELVGYRTQGINIVAPPLFALLSVDAGGNIVPSQYAIDARNAGLDLITWSLERSGFTAGNTDDSYYQTFGAGIKREGDIMQAIDVLARQVGVIAIFSDWPATTTFYANCADLK